MLFLGREQYNGDLTDLKPIKEGQHMSELEVNIRHAHWEQSIEADFMKGFVVLKGRGFSNSPISSWYSTIQNAERSMGELSSILKVPIKINDAWDSAKRSREYLNAKEQDIDARYFAHAACDFELPTKKF